MFKIFNRVLLFIYNIFDIYMQFTEPMGDCCLSYKNLCRRGSDKGRDFFLLELNLQVNLFKSLKQERDRVRG